MTAAPHIVSVVLRKEGLEIDITIDRGGGKWYIRIRDTKKTFGNLDTRKDHKPKAVHSMSSVPPGLSL